MDIAQVEVGTRVTTRYIDVDGKPNEAVGVVTSNDGVTLIVEARRGTVEIPVAKLQAWRVVPERTRKAPRWRQ